jgi:hypothetical protein
MSFKYETSSEPLRIPAKLLFLDTPAAIDYTGLVNLVESS